MIWAGIAIALVLAFIGGTMVYDGANPLSRILGLVVSLIAGIVLGFSIPLPGWLGYVKLDEKACAQYVWLGEDWRCVPWEEAG